MIEEEEARPGVNIGKTDISYKIRLDEMPSIELRNWMFNDVVVNLWESRPKFESV
jgi:hypothetical protein